MMVGTAQMGKVVWLSMFFILIFCHQLDPTNAQRRSPKPQIAVNPNEPIPKTSFSCRDRVPGYYADPETGCQLYHMCQAGGRQFTYRCPEHTLFQQRMMVCDHWFMVDCQTSPQHYAANLLIGDKNKPFIAAGETVIREFVQDPSKLPEQRVIDQSELPDAPETKKTSQQSNRRTNSPETFTNFDQRILPSTIINSITTPNPTRNTQSSPSTQNFTPTPFKSQTSNFNTNQPRKNQPQNFTPKPNVELTPPPIFAPTISRRIDQNQPQNSNFERRADSNQPINSNFERRVDSNQPQNSNFERRVDSNQPSAFNTNQNIPQRVQQSRNSNIERRIDINQPPNSNRDRKLDFNQPSNFERKLDREPIVLTPTFSKNSNRRIDSTQTPNFTPTPLRLKTTPKFQSTKFTTVKNLQNNQQTTFKPIGLSLTTLSRIKSSLNLTRNNERLSTVPYFPTTTYRPITTVNDNNDILYPATINSLQLNNDNQPALLRIIPDTRRMFFIPNSYEDIPSDFQQQNLDYYDNLRSNFKSMKFNDDFIKNDDLIINGCPSKCYPAFFKPGSCEPCVILR